MIGRDMGNARTLLAGTALPRLETQMLLQHVLQVPRAWLIAHDTDVLAATTVERFQDLVQQRLAGRPMAYLLGHREFMGHKFAVNPDVLIPRPDTELLVETALHHIDGLQAPRVLDLGTGSGAIAISIKLACPHATVVATDVSARALAVARLNAQYLSATVEFLPSSWYHSLLGQPAFDLIVSNPPYIAANDPHLDQGDLRYEPVQALSDNADGLTALGAIVQGGRAHLKPAGALWVEHGWDQAPAVRQFLLQARFERVGSLPDLAGVERVSGGYL